MDKNTLYPLISIIAVVVVAAAIYSVAGMFGGTQVHAEEGGHEAEGTELSGAEALFFGAVEKPLSHETYSYGYTETASGGYNNSVFMTSSENSSYIRKEDALFTRELFVGENLTVLCLENVNERVCAQVTQNSSFYPYAYSLATLFFDHGRIEQNVENNMMFIEYGAVVFGEDIVETAYSGRECSEVSYTLDYSKLTVEQMRSIGMDPKSPEVLISKQFNYTICIDPDTLDVVHKNLSYLNLGTPEYTESLTTFTGWDSPSDVEFPQELSGEEEMEGFFSVLSRTQENYRACLASDNFDSCIREEAMLSRNEKLCTLIMDLSKRDICMVNVALEKGNSSLCSQVQDEGIDGCYLEFAWKFNDSAYCASIRNETALSDCEALFSYEEQNSSSAGGEEPARTGYSQNAAWGEGGEPECTYDSDCAPAGSSSHLCLPASLSDVATTSEYLPEYGCLNLTSCICSEGACSWEQNQDYLNCLEEMG